MGAAPVSEPVERDSLLYDLWRESCNCWVATARWAQVAMIAGFATLAAVSLLPLPVPAYTAAWIRIVSYGAFMAGTIAHVRAMDEFYMRVYVYSAAFAAVASSLILFAAFELRWPLTTQGFAIISATFAIGFVYTFVQMRRP
jgi:hypothetical protein